MINRTIRKSFKILAIILGLYTLLFVLVLAHMKSLSEAYDFKAIEQIGIKGYITTYVELPVALPLLLYRFNIDISQARFRDACKQANDKPFTYETIKAIGESCYINQSLDSCTPDAIQFVLDHNKNGSSSKDQVPQPLLIPGSKRWPYDSWWCSVTPKDGKAQTKTYYRSDN